MNSCDKCQSILVVEDDEDIREALASVLSQEGYDVHTADNGKAGLEALEHVPRPCLILLDMMMPVMNGFEFLTALDREDVLATIPIVVVSAFDDLAKRAPGTAGFVKKPVDLEALFGFVERYCG